MFYLLIYIDNTFLDTLSALEHKNNTFFVDNQTTYDLPKKHLHLFSTTELYDDIKPTGSIIHYIIANIMARDTHIKFITKTNKHKQVNNIKKELVTTICNTLYTEHKQDPDFHPFTWDVDFLDDNTEDSQLDELYKTYDMLIDDAPYRMIKAMNYSIEKGMVAYPYNTHMYNGTITFFKPNTKERKHRQVERTSVWKIFLLS